MYVYFAAYHSPASTILMIKSTPVHLEQIFRSDFFSVEMDQTLSLVKTVWLRGVTDGELKEAAMQLREILESNKVDLLLTNAQNLNSLSQDSKEWLSTCYYNLLSGTGIKKMARILPTNLFRHIALEAVITRADAICQLKYEVKNFSSEHEGLRWLLG